MLLGEVHRRVPSNEKLLLAADLGCCWLPSTSLMLLLRLRSRHCKKKTHLACCFLGARRSNVRQARVLLISNCQPIYWLLRLVFVGVWSETKRLAKFLFLLSDSSSKLMIFEIRNVTNFLMCKFLLYLISCILNVVFIHKPLKKLCFQVMEINFFYNSSSNC